MEEDLGTGWIWEPASVVTGILKSRSFFFLRVSSAFLPLTSNPAIVKRHVLLSPSHSAGPIQVPTALTMLLGAVLNNFSCFLWLQGFDMHFQKR